MVVGIVRTSWAGTSGGPGLTQLAFRAGDGADFISPAQVQSAVNAVRAFWNSTAQYLPDDLALTVQPTVDMYSEATAELIGSQTAATPPTSVAGTSTAVFSMASGMKLNLQTGAIRYGRRVRGSIFIVPASSNVYSSGGTVLSAVRTAINGYAATMLGAFTTASCTVCVWSRPQDTPTVRAGALTPVTIAEVNEKAAILRGRRD